MAGVGISKQRPDLTGNYAAAEIEARFSAFVDMVAQAKIASILQGIIRFEAGVAQW